MGPGEPRNPDGTQFVGRMGSRGSNLSDTIRMLQQLMALLGAGRCGAWGLDRKYPGGWGTNVH